MIPSRSGDIAGLWCPSCCAVEFDGYPILVQCKHGRRDSIGHFAGQAPVKVCRRLDVVKVEDAGGGPHVEQRTGDVESCGDHAGGLLLLNARHVGADMHDRRFRMRS